MHWPLLSHQWRPRLVASLTAIGAFGLAACNGTAIVTLTATASTDTFLAYRVGLTSVELESSSGSTTLEMLPTSTTVDLAKLVDLSEVLGSTAVSKAKYKTAVITFDYSAADIIYDDGTPHGLSLKPIGANGKSIGRVTVKLTLDPADRLDISTNKTSRLSLDFELAASNTVEAASGTVTVAPLIVASATAIDGKNVRIRGPLSTTDAANSRYTVKVEPFDFPVREDGAMRISVSDSTTYEIDGAASTGTAGLTALAALSADAMTTTLGTMTSSSSTSTTTSNGTSTSSTTTEVTYEATQVLAGSSDQDSKLDRLSGIVSARTGNTLTIDDPTMIGSNGTNTLIAGTGTVTVSDGTTVTLGGQGSAEGNTVAQISVGSLIHVFGVAATSSTDVTLDATTGHARLDLTSASGLVTAVGSASLDLNLTTLGGRSIKAFNFDGTGSSSSTSANAASYTVNTNNLDLSNSSVGAAVEVSGFTAAFGSAPPAFSASTLADPSTITATLVVDYGSGTAAPFTTYDSSEIDLTRTDTKIGSRHSITVGAKSINVVGMSSDPLIVPSTAVSSLVFAIAHTASATVENFITYSAFITKLTSDLNGSVLVTCVTAAGEYTSSSYTFTATSITVTLNN